MIECSHLDNEQITYLYNNVDFFINLIDNKNDVENIYSKSKSLGEGTMTMRAIEFIFNNNITFDNFFKITGRYSLSNNFLYKNFDNDNIVIRYIHNDNNNVVTSLYKLKYQTLYSFYNFLCNNIHLMKKYISYENLFALFLKQIKDTIIIHMDKIGVSGFISVSNDFIDV